MSDQFTGKILAEKYQIDSLLSAGNSGNLYHGTHLLMEKPVAVKVLPAALAVDEKIVKSFSDEARTVSRISHPNILSVTDYGSDKDGTVFIVYEDAGGETLSETIKRVGKLSLGRANRIVKEVAAALSAAQTNAIIHQNLSSQNILLRRTPADTIDVKVLNFGTGTFDINDLDYPIEKIEYLAPEQCTLGGTIDHRTDVYALGVILFQMLAGEVPFTAANGTDLLFKQTQDPPPPISAFRPDLPKEVDVILLTALAKNPTIRYQSVNEVAEALNQVSLAYPDREEADTAFIPRIQANFGAVGATEPPPQNNIWKTAFIVLAGISLLGASFIYLTSGKQTNPTTMQTDANGMPVQPVNPASGTTEQGLSNMDSFDPNIYSNSNSMMTDGGGYPTDWVRPQNAPPLVPGSGDPYPVNGQMMQQGNQVYMDPGNGSIFMPQDDGSFVIMKPKNSNTDSNVNTQAPKKNTNSNVNPQPPTNTPVKTTPTPANTAAPTEAKPTPTPGVKPKATPNKAEPAKPASTKPPSATEKRPASAKEQDTN